VGLKDMIDALEIIDQLPKIILITVTIEEMRPMTIELSSKVQDSIPKVVDKVMEILQAIIMEPK